MTRMLIVFQPWTQRQSREHVPGLVGYAEPLAHFTNSLLNFRTVISRSPCE